ncbi:hypothetical protein HOL34_01795 [bacterium]|nr:hypothetical protein [bacterium]MBT3903617.1 hypothetical protein [bacterium]MBT4578215.1 hypothetical protein [bacterium]MBT5345884.1 hypothetical protein [bacterium]MBT6130651.1 hypothetical protein [bacterium]
MEFFNKNTRTTLLVSLLCLTAGSTLCKSDQNKSDQPQATQQFDNSQVYIGLVDRVIARLEGIGSNNKWITDTEQQKAALEINSYLEDQKTIAKNINGNQIAVFCYLVGQLTDALSEVKVNFDNIQIAKIDKSSHSNGNEAATRLLQKAAILVDEFEAATEERPLNLWETFQRTTSHTFENVKGHKAFYRATPYAIWLAYQFDQQKNGPLNSFVNNNLSGSAIAVKGMNIASFVLASSALHRDWSDFWEWIGKKYDKYRGMWRGEQPHFFLKNTSVKHGHSFGDLIVRPDIRESLDTYIDYASNTVANDDQDIKIDRLVMIDGPNPTAIVEAVTKEIERNIKVVKPRFEAKYFSAEAAEFSRMSNDSFSDKILEAGVVCVLIKRSGVTARNSHDRAKLLEKIYTIKRLNKPIIIFVHTNNKEDARYLGTITSSVAHLSLELPTQDEIVQWFTNDMNRRCINKDRFDLEAIAKLYDGMTFKEIKEAFGRALCVARRTKTPLSSEQLELSIGNK